MTLSAPMFLARLALSFVLVSGLLPIPSSLAAQETNTVSIPRFYKVSDHLYRGALPSPADLRALSQLGIATVLDLRAPDEASRAEEEQVHALEMKYFHVPMHSFGAPSQEVVERALHVLQDPANWPVFVHCRFGVDRTGTVIACYRIQAESWSNRKAQEEAAQMGMHRLERGMKRFILNFQPE